MNDIHQFKIEVVTYRADTGRMAVDTEMLADELRRNADEMEGRTDQRVVEVLRLVADQVEWFADQAKSMPKLSRRRQRRLERQAMKKLWGQ